MLKMVKSQGKQKVSEVQNVEFEGIVDYARVHKPSTANSKVGQYSVSLRLNTPQKLQEFKDLMVKHNLSLNVFNPKTKKEQPRIKDNGDGTYSVNIKRDAVNSQGKPVTIEVVNAKKEPISPTVLIGNGSTAVVSMFTYQGEEGGVIRLAGIQILDLVPFSNSKFKVREGYSGGTEGTTSHLSEDLTDESSPF